MIDPKSVLLRQPTLEDGMRVYRLIEQCPPLDTNSSYCNLLQCSHFSSTSVAAEREGEIVGFISGFVLPDRTNTLFVWQIAVSEKARKIGLASRMLKHILCRPSCSEVVFIETSITRDNKASLAVFEKFARENTVPLNISDWMDKDKHFDGEHDSEPLVRVGPLSSRPI